VFLPVLAAAVAINVMSVLKSYLLTVTFLECSMVIGVLLVSFLGAALILLAMRAYRGWQVSHSGLEKTIGRSERLLEWIAVIAVAALICVSSPLENGADVARTIVGLIGVVLGGVLSVSAFWLLRDLNPAMTRILFAFYVVLMIIVPSAFAWMASSPRQFPWLAGYEFYAIGFVVGAATLLFQVFLVRKMDFRIRRFGFEKSASKKAEKVVVDPFSD